MAQPRPVAITCLTLSLLFCGLPRQNATGGAPPSADVGDEYASQVTYIEQANVVFINSSFRAVFAGRLSESNEEEFRKLARFPQLRSVVANAVAIESKSLSHLIGIKSLKEVVLQSVPLTNDAVEPISRCEGLTAVSFLGAMHIDDTGIQRLERLKKLEWLCVRGTKVTKQGARELRKKLPGLKHVDILDDLKTNK